MEQDSLEERGPIWSCIIHEEFLFSVRFRCLAELGDYDPVRYKPGYVSEFRFLAHQSTDLEAKIAELHKTMR